MNILPFIFALLIVFSICSTASLQRALLKQDLFTSLKGIYSVQRKIDSEIEKRFFASLKSEKETKQKHTNSGSTKPFKSFRERKVFSEDSKLSLFLLTKTPTIQQKLFLKEVMKKLIIKLYSNTLLAEELSKEGNIDRLIEAIFVAVVNVEENAPLSTLKIEDEELKILFYKICQGTSSYALRLEGGYPSLEYFVNCQDNKNFVINFQAASKPVLTAFFGEEITTGIINAEEEKWKKHKRHIPLSSIELSEEIVAYTHEAFDVTLIENLVSFSKKEMGKPAICVIDSKSGIFTEVKASEKLSPFIYPKE